MIVHGVKIPEAALEACIERMRGGPFTASSLEDVARANGVPGTHNNDPIAMRVADRLIQGARKAGAIERRGRGWIGK